MNDEETTLTGSPESVSVPGTLYPLKPFVAYQVTEQDLEALSQTGLSAKLHLAGASISATAAASFMISLGSTQIPDAKLYAVYVAVVILSVLVFAYCIIRYICAEVSLHRKRQGLKPQTHLEPIENGKMRTPYSGVGDAGLQEAVSALVGKLISKPSASSKGTSADRPEDN